MNKKIFIVLALASLFVVRINALSCTDGSTWAGSTGCSTCSDVNTCTACSGGYTGATCTQCAAGTYKAAGANTGSCTTCAAGTWSAAGATACTNCAAGTALATTGGTAASQCTTCAAGTWAAAGASSCTNCAAGTSRSATAGTQASDCTTCAAGTYSLAGASTCTNCPAGTYRTSTGGAQLSDCTSCAANTYSATAGATLASTCTACPTGQTSAAGSASCGCDTSCTAHGGTCSGSTCSGCSVGTYKVGTVSQANDGCVAYATANPTTDSPSSAYNVTPIAVFASTEYTSPSAFAYASSSIQYTGGFNDQSYFVWGIITSGTTLALNRRTISGANMTLAKSTNSTSDVAITTSISPSTIKKWCSGNGYLGLVTRPTYIWNDPASGAPAYVAVDLYFQYIAVNGTAFSTAKGLTGNTNKNVILDVQQCWYDNGIFFIAWIQSTHVPGVAATNGAGGAADTWTLNGLYIQGINVTSGGLYYTNSTSGVQSIAWTTSTTGTCGGATCTAASATVDNNALDPRGSGGYSFSFAKQNYTNTIDNSTYSYLWTTGTDTNPATPVYGTIKYGTITISTGAGSAGTVLATQVANGGTTFANAATASYVVTKYYAAGFLGSSSTYGVFVGKGVMTCTAYTNTGCTAVYSMAGYYNGSTTATANVTIATGYGGSITYSPAASPTSVSFKAGISIAGFGTSDGFVLLETQTSNTADSTTSPYFPTASLLQAETFFANGTTKVAATSLGTYMDTPMSFQDTNGSIIVAWTTSDYANGQLTYQGYMGKYNNLQLTGIFLTTIFGLLSFMIVALFAF